MTAWDVLTSKSVNTGNAWHRLNNVTNTTVVLNNGKPSNFTADSVISLTVVPIGLTLNATSPELVFSTDAPVVLLNTTPDDYKFSITTPIVNLEA